MSATDEAVFATGKTTVGTLDEGDDLQEGIERLIRESGMAFCRVNAIGSLAMVHMTYYDQAQKADLDILIEEPMMLIVLTGTGILQNGLVQTHCHLVVGDQSGECYGGDLSPGCIVFSCEVMIQELTGPRVSRQTDDATGLSHLRFNESP